MQKETLFDITILGLIALLLVLEFNPFMVVTIPMEFTIFVCLIISDVLLFTSMFWRQRPQDEREMTHQQKAGELSFLLGALSLSIGIIWQLLHHALDRYLIFALAVMVITKIITRIFLRFRE